MNRNCTKYNLSDWDSERYIDQLILESDETYMSCPTIDSEPDLLISKVRQHYMKYMVKLLSVNYETNQKLLNKNIYLPSGIWRCAQIVEMKAARKSMVMQLYRANILAVIKAVKTDTETGKLYRFLLETMRTPPNEKKTQTSTSTDGECYCKCHTNSKKRRKSLPQSELNALLQPSNNVIPQVNQFKIPEALNMQTHTPEPIAREDMMSLQRVVVPKVVQQTVIPNSNNTIEESISVYQHPPTNKMMTPMHTENDGDDIMMQLEKLFHTDQTDEDLFEATLNMESNKVPNETTIEDTMSKLHHSAVENSNTAMQSIISNGLVIENHSAQIKSLDERLSTLTGILINNETAGNAPEKKEDNRHNSKEKEVKKKKIVSKWHCEEYFLKKDLLETLYQIGDNNRTKLARIKTMYLQLFGEDDEDDEAILSPIDDSPHLILSCKTRISMWVLTTLTPYYGMGRIRGKNLFKSVVKYLIDLIFRCKQYPDKHEVTNFVKDFIQNHAMITCEADFKDIIENVRQEPYVFA